MRTEEFRRNSGFLLLMLVITFGIAMVVMVLYMGSFNPFSPWQGSEKNRYADVNSMPWDEGRLFWTNLLDGYDMSGRRPPFRAQPKVTKNISYRTDLYDGNRQLGVLKLTVFKNFDAWAGWTGNFRIGGRQYEVAPWEDKVLNRTVNTFSGNIAPLKIYEDQNGKDRAKLYVITTGPYELRGMEKSDIHKGTAFVTAWIDKKYRAEGMVAIQTFIDGKQLILHWGPVEPTDE